jgi:hypothetical protein
MLGTALLASDTLGGLAELINRLRTAEDPGKPVA